MTAHHEFGKPGEQMAAEWLELQGIHLVFRNWKSLCSIWIFSTAVLAFFTLEKLNLGTMIGLGNLMTG